MNKGKLVMAEVTARNMCVCVCVCVCVWGNASYRLQLEGIGGDSQETTSWFQAHISSIILLPQRHR